MPADFTWQEQSCFTYCSLKKREDTEEVICLISEKGNQEEKAGTLLVIQGLTKPMAEPKALFPFVLFCFFSFQRGNSDVSMHPFFYAHL